LDFQTRDSIAVLTFARAVGYQRITRTLLAELSDLLGSIRRERLFRGVAIASNEESSTTGAELGEIVPLEGISARQFAEMGQAVCKEIERFPLPVVAAIRGYCLGGGLDLALACHGRVATYDASFGYPGVARGLLTGWGGTQRLPRLIGKAQALQILLTAERVPATQALTLGLVDELASSADLIECAVRRCESLHRNGTRD